jgi:hypothetical protein
LHRFYISKIILASLLCFIPFIANVLIKLKLLLLILLSTFALLRLYNVIIAKNLKAYYYLRVLVVQNTLTLIYRGYTLASLVVLVYSFVCLKSSVAPIAVKAFCAYKNVSTK